MGPCSPVYVSACLRYIYPNRTHETLIASIRAYGAQELFDMDMRKRINKYTRTALTFYHVNRWISVRMDVLGAVFSGIITTYLVYGGRLEAGYAGFTLSIVLSFTRQVLVWIRVYNMLEIEGA